jgi:hypothetical protein
MRAFVNKHPAVTQFLVLLGVVLLCLPIFGLAWYALAETGRILIDDGCRARNYSCEYEGEFIIIGSLVLMPFFIYFFIYIASKISGLITNRLLAWAGLNPDLALL